MRFVRAAALSALVLSLVRPATAQGTFTNYETPQTHPIEVVMVGGTELVLVCNTPDNALEVWRATAPPQFVQRVSVGLGPGTVRWHAGVGKAYVCNFDGDSVSIVDVQVQGGSVSASLELTRHVGDEPADLAFDPSGTVALVTLSSRHQSVLVAASTLASFGGPARMELLFDHTAPQGPNNPLFAVNMPRAVAWLPGDKIFVLNLMGDHAFPLPVYYDVDLYRIDAPFAPLSARYVDEIGTTNHSFAITGDGSTMFVVGTRAQNLTLQTMGVGNVAAAPTGFVQSWLSVVDLNAMQVAPESAGGGGIATLSINLNRDYSQMASVAEVPSADAIVQPTGIALHESAGAVQRIALTGFHSDNVAVLIPNQQLPAALQQPSGYLVQTVNLAPRAGATVVGPRGVAFNAAGDIVFTNGRLDNTLHAIPLATMTSAQPAGQLRDPTPALVHTGRQFLYSNRFSRPANAVPGDNNGFVSCASCHVDGRTDGLMWDLSDSAVLPLAPELNDQPDPSTLFPFLSFPAHKGFMITQTLQGLIDYETSEPFQEWATNAPYHWRGDKPDFVDFNEAFVNLQGMAAHATSPAPSGPTARGIDPNDMVDYRRFVNTIRHPPNPEEQQDRRPGGQIPASPHTHPNINNPLPPAFHGAMLGRLLFHNLQANGSRSCVDCHSLPDGSSNTLTFTDVHGPIFGPQVDHPFETAALRNVFQREGISNLTTLPTVTGSTMEFPDNAGLANTGLTHDGSGPNGINRFVMGFAHAMPGQTTSEDAEQLSAIIQYVRQFDTGSAPLAGFGFTLDTSLNPLDQLGNKAVFDLMEIEVTEANVGFGLQIHTGSAIRKGFFFVPGAGWVDAASPTSAPVTRQAMLGNVLAGDVVVVQGTPLGTERRWANPAGIGQQIVSTSSLPANLQLEPMAPMTFHVGITDLLGNLPSTVETGTRRGRIKQFHLAVQGQFGIPQQQRHEPPRRFRVSGDNIRPGASLLLVCNDGTSPTSFQLPGMLMRLYPTDNLSPTNQNAGVGRPVWETELELDEQMTYAFLCGGPDGPDVRLLLDQHTVTGVPVAPVLQTQFNNYIAVVVNEDGTWAQAPAAALTVQDGR